MSRLDDELKVAFRRVEPSADFAERVLRRINNPPDTRPSLWQKLKSFFEPPVARWVAVGVATSLLVAIFASQYQRLREVTPERAVEPGVAQQAPEVKTDTVAPKLGPAPSPERTAPRTVRHRPAGNKAALNRNLLARQTKERQQKIEAERAKEQVMLALQIASSTLNEANKMVRGDD
jgi:hypothetical protein